jgi:hypothetical protein
MAELAKPLRMRTSSSPATAARRCIFAGPPQCAASCLPLGACGIEQCARGPRHCSDRRGPSVRAPHSLRPVGLVRSREFPRNPFPIFGTLRMVYVLSVNGPNH